MTVPRILLSSSKTPEITNWVPPAHAQDYKELVRLARDLFGRELPEDNCEVHFHLLEYDIGLTTCNARLIPELWENGDYFAGDFATTGELYVYAHFVSNKPVKGEYQLSEQSYKDFCSLELGIGGVGTDQIEEFHWSGPFLHNGSTQILDPSLVDPVLRGVEDATSEQIIRPAVQHGSPDASTTEYPPLPTDATPDNYFEDRKAAESDNSKDEFHTGRDIQNLSKVRRKQIVKARLIAGKYGASARKPCDSCKSRQKICRIIHPSLFTESWHQVNKFWRNRSGRLACASCCSGNRSKCYAA